MFLFETHRKKREEIRNLIKNVMFRRAQKSKKGNRYSDVRSQTYPNKSPEKLMLRHYFKLSKDNRRISKQQEKEMALQIQRDSINS